VIPVERHGVALAMLGIGCGMAAALAGYIPAKKATTLDPVVALRAD
jgi:ABC-type antimicrobial peptide transport system permease subunit